MSSLVDSAASWVFVWDWVKLAMLVYLFCRKKQNWDHFVHQRELIERIWFRYHPTMLNSLSIYTKLQDILIDPDFNVCVGNVLTHKKVGHS